jgi:hypothetical protein
LFYPVGKKKRSSYNLQHCFFWVSSLRSAVHACVPEKELDKRLTLSLITSG